jgi:hypothetical protein
MAEHIVSLTKTVEVGDEFEPWTPTGRRVRIISKIYNQDMTISYRVKQIAGSGRMQNTTITRRVLKRQYKRVVKTERTLLAIKTREVFIGLEPIHGAA